MSRSTIGSLKERVTPGNPLGMIALFVFLIETVATVSLHAVADQPYAAVLVWFIVAFPSVIALLFFVLLWFKREALYAPMDFPDVQTFKELILKKVERIEVKQDVARIDSDTTLDDVYRTVDRLLELDDPWSAISVGRAFLKENQYDKSIKVFEHLKGKIRKSDEAYYKLVANIAYAQIGLPAYADAIKNLLEVKTLKRGAYFGPWHSLALAYAYFKDGKTSDYQQWLDYTRDNGGDELDTDFFVGLYPEIEKDILTLSGKNRRIG